MGMDTDALAYLAATPAARTLLGAYHGSAPQPAATWSPRLFEIDGIEPTQLSALHGRLIAFGYLDVDVTDAAIGVRYQVTTAGRHVLAQPSSASSTESVDTAGTPAETASDD
jgi:hypothetical protein